MGIKKNTEKEKLMGMARSINLPITEKEEVDIRKFHVQRGRSPFLQRNPWLSRRSGYDASPGVEIPGRRLRDRISEALTPEDMQLEDTRPYERVLMLGFVRIIEGSSEEMLEFRFTYERHRHLATVFISDRDDDREIDCATLGIADSESIEAWDYGKNITVRLAAIENESIICFITITE